MLLPDGCTQREHLESLARQRARSGLPPPEGLSEYECPDAAEHLWRWFLEVSRRRGSNGFGANPISYSELEAWSRLTETRLSALEVDWIMALDDARAAASAAAAPARADLPVKKKT